MPDFPLISICIPAYKRVAFLKRLLESIAIQKCKDFEVIISDDSPGLEVKELCIHYSSLFPLHYVKNSVPLGTPENWNESIRHAKGKWIKLMHDDDWFSTECALEKFAEAANQHSSGFIFSAYANVFLSDSKEEKITPESFRFRQLKNEPSSLLSRNIIGPPSVVMHRNDRQHWYDRKLKWLVDIDMYIRIMESNELIYLPEFLVNVGISGEQVTAFVHGAPDVEIPEHFYFIEKTGIVRLRNILVYDYWWRFIRNFSLSDIKKIKKYGYNGPIHPIFISMMTWQKKLPRFLLKNGFFSKTIMSLHFLFNRHKLGS